METKPPVHCACKRTGAKYFSPKASYADAAAARSATLASTISLRKRPTESSAGQPPSKGKSCHVCRLPNRDATLDLTKNPCVGQKGEFIARHTLDDARMDLAGQHGGSVQPAAYQGRLAAFIALDRLGLSTLTGPQTLLGISESVSAKEGLARRGKAQASLRKWAQPEPARDQLWHVPTFSSHRNDNNPTNAGANLARTWAPSPCRRNLGLALCGNAAKEPGARLKCEFALSHLHGINYQ